jgi:hypothetical protein
MMAHNDEASASGVLRSLQLNLDEAAVLYWHRVPRASTVQTAARLARLNRRLHGATVATARTTYAGPRQGTAEPDDAGGEEPADQCARQPDLGTSI